MERFRVTSVSGLRAVAERLVEILGKSDGGGRVVAFYGEMGAGKTTLIREICELMGVTVYVNSPSFAIVNVYPCDGGEVNHFDFYRIKRIEEAYDFGYQEYFYGGNVCLVEWPEVVQELLPEGYLRVEIRVLSEQEREVTIMN